MTTRSSIKRALGALSNDIAFPATPPLVEAVAARIAAKPAAPPARWRMLAIAAAVTVALVAVVPSSRQAVANLLGIGPLEITQVAELTPASTLRSLGRLTTLEAAREATSFGLVGVDGVQPDAVFVDSTVPGSMVTLAYGSPADGWRLLITQLDGSTDHQLIRKEVGTGTVIQPVTVAGAPGVWIEGAPHTVMLLAADGEPRADAARLAGNTLVTTSNGVLVRIEADSTLSEAQAVAQRLVPDDQG